MKQNKWPFNKASEPKPPKDVSEHKDRSRRNAPGARGGGLKAYKSAFWHVLAAGLRRTPSNQWVMTRGVYRGEGNYNEAVRIYSRKKSSKGAMAAGFLVSARKFGLKQRKGPKDAQPKSGGSASKSTGAKATARLKANSVNAVKGSFEVGRETMDRAIRYVLRDMEEWAIKLLEKDAEKAANKAK